MKKLPIAVAALLVFLGSPALAHEVSVGDASQAPGCDSLVATVSGSDFQDCRANHDDSESCREWARDRQARLEANIGAACQRAVRRLGDADGCASEGKQLAIRYHVHRGHDCTAAGGCTGSDGNPPPHDHWERVHLRVDCR